FRSHTGGFCVSAVTRVAPNDHTSAAGEFGAAPVSGASYELNTAELMSAPERMTSPEGRKLSLESFNRSPTAMMFAGLILPGISLMAAFCAFRPGISVLKTDVRPVPPSQRSKGNFPLTIWPSHLSGATAVFMTLLVSVFYPSQRRFRSLGWK